MSHLERSLSAATLLAWLFVAWHLRVRGLDVYFYSPDEALHVAEAAASSVSALLRYLAQEDTHPPLHYLVLRALQRLGSSDGWMRGSSIVAGFALIPVAFVLGRQVSGAAGGLVAAFLATFGYGISVQSQLVRPYALELLFLAGGLCLLYPRDGSPGRGRVFGYLLLALLAVLTQFSAVIVMAAVGVVRSLVLFATQRPLREQATWVVGHLLLALLLMLLLWPLVTTLMQSYQRDELTSVFSGGFPDRHLLRFFVVRMGHTFQYAGFPFVDLATPTLALLVLAGLLQLLKERRYELFLLLPTALAIHLLLAILRVYPFTGGRHTLPLLPLLLIAAAAAGQSAWRGTRHVLSRLVPSGSPLDHLTRGLAVVLLVLTSTWAFGQVEKHERYRGRYADDEFPLERRHYERTLDHLEQAIRARDIVVCDKQTAYYAFLDSSIELAERLTPRVSRARLRGMDVYYLDGTAMFRSSEDLRTFMAELKPLLDEPRAGRIWFLSLGWRVTLFDRIASSQATVPDDAVARSLRRALARSRARVVFSGSLAGGGLVYPLATSEVYAALRLN